MSRHKLSSTAKMGIALCFIAIALLAYGLATERWFTSHSSIQYGQAGLRSVSVCDARGESCQRHEWNEPSVYSAAEGLAAFQTAAKLTTGVGITAMVLLGLSAILLLAGKFVFVPIAPASAAILACIGAAAVALYAAQKNPLYELGFRSDFSLVAFLMGAGVGFVGAIFVGRERPEDWL